MIFQRDASTAEDLMLYGHDWTGQDKQEMMVHCVCYCKQISVKVIAAEAKSFHVTKK